MIFGIGTDIAKNVRFEKWINSPNMIERFFNEKELMNSGTISAKCEHYSARFAAKEAFSKALGTGLLFDLKDAYICNDANGKPELIIQKTALELFEKTCGKIDEYVLHVSLSHEKEYATAFVIIEKK